MNNNDLLSITDFAAIVGVSRQSIYNWMVDGTVKAEFIAGRWALKKADALKLKKERANVAGR